MQQVTVQFLRALTLVEIDVIVRIVATPTSCLAVPQTNLAIGIPVGGTNPAASDTGQTGHGPRSELWIPFYFKNGSAKFRRKILVGIEREYEVVRGLRKGKILLLDVPFERMLDELHVSRLTNCACVVGRKRIDNDNFIRHLRQRVDAAPYLL